MNRMKEFRAQKNMRQLDLAEKVNISLTWIWALENGFHKRVSTDIKQRVADALDSSVEELFGD